MGPVAPLVARALPDLLSLVETVLEEGLQHIADQAQRAGKIIKSVHDFVRRRERQREAVDVQVLLDAIMPLVQLQARKLYVRTQVRVEDDLPALWCDRTMVEQVLLNLARNAMQAMDDEPEAGRLLELRVRRAQTGERTAHAHGWLEFSVADTGRRGITPEIAEKLFTPFHYREARRHGSGAEPVPYRGRAARGFLAHAAKHPHGTGILVYSAGRAWPGLAPPQE